MLSAGLLGPLPRAAGQTPLELETRRLVSADSLLSGDEATRAVATLQAVVDTSGEADVRAPALLRLGLLKLRLYAWEQPESVRTARPDDYFFNEIAGSWLYQGLELRELEGRYPEHVLADDAAYAATGLPLGGECEGWVPCYLYGATGRLVDFLEDHPTSGHASAAVDSVIAGYRTVLAGHPDLRIATDDYDPAEVRADLERWEGVARRLHEPERTRALEAIAALWRRFGVSRRVSPPPDGFAFPGTGPAPAAFLPARTPRPTFAFDAGGAFLNHPVLSADRPQLARS